MDCSGPNAAEKFYWGLVVGVQEHGPTCDRPAAAADINRYRFAGPNIHIAVLKIVTTRLFPPGNPGIAGRHTVKPIMPLAVCGACRVVNGVESSFLNFRAKPASRKVNGLIGQRLGSFAEGAFNARPRLQHNCAELNQFSDRSLAVTFFVENDHRAVGGIIGECETPITIRNSGGHFLRTLGIDRHRHKRGGEIDLGFRKRLAVGSLDDAGEKPVSRLEGTARRGRGLRT